MGIFDEAKNLAEEHSDVVSGGIDKAEQFADEKTGGQYSDQIQQGGEFVENQLGVNNGASQDSPSGSDATSQQDRGYGQQDQQGQQDYQPSQDDQLGSPEQSGL